LQATIAWSYDLLPEAEKTMLTRLSVFVGGFDLQATEAVCADDRIDELAVVDLLGSLVDKSLVHIDDTSGHLRYRMLETVRAFAAERLHAPEAFRRAHRDHFLARAEAADRSARTEERARSYDALALDKANLRIAAAFSLDDPDADPGLRLVGAMPALSSRFGWSVEWTAIGLAQLAVPAAQEATLARGRALYAVASALLSSRGNFDQVADMSIEAHRIARVSGDALLGARSRYTLGFARSRQGRADEAVEILRDSVALAREAADERALAQALALYGAAVVNVGGDGRGALIEAAALVRDQGSAPGLVTALERLGLAELTEGDTLAARQHLREAMALARGLSQPDKAVMNTALNLGIAELMEGDHTVARTLFREALGLAHANDVAAAVPYGLLGTALTLESSDPERASRLLGAVERRLEDLRMRLEALEARLHEGVTGRLGERLGEDGFASARDAGRAWSVDDAVAAAMRVGPA
jgi:tetratricopeptide (TPR) repeat protein